MMKNNEILNSMFKKYQLNNDEMIELKTIINPIFFHDEFQRRMTEEFYHHGTITLGEHILEDAILTYKLSKKYMNRHPNSNYHLDLAVKIAMLHDLYTYPWQNRNIKVKFFNKHGFRHPIEAVINSIIWFPSLFYNQNEANILIDGIIHHMFPLPVRSCQDNLIQNMEIEDNSLFNQISDDNKKIILNSLKRKKIGPVSISKSLYKEGKIMSKADKKVSLHQIKDFSSAKALLTGHNKKIK